MTEKQHMEHVQSLGCIICLLFYGAPDSPAEIHHILDQNTNERLGHKHTLPLCERHHRQPDKKNKRWTSRHPHQRQQFEERYMPEADLLVAVYRALERLWPLDYEEVTT